MNSITMRICFIVCAISVIVLMFLKFKHHNKDVQYLASDSSISILYNINRYPGQKFFFVIDSIDELQRTDLTYLFPVSIHNKIGFIDNKGKLIIASQFTQVQDFTEGLLPVTSFGKVGYIDEYGNYAVKPKYQAASSFSDGLAVISINSKFGYINHGGHIVIQPRYYETYGFADDLAWVSNFGYWGCIDKSGNVIIPFKYGLGIYSNHYWFSEGLSWVQQGQSEFIMQSENNDNIKLETPCFLNVYGNSMIAIKGMTDASFFDHDECFIKVNNKWGLINRKGNWIIKPAFDGCITFDKGMNQIANRDFGLIGQEVENPELGISYIEHQERKGINLSENLRNIYSFSEKIAIVRRNSLFGFVDINGKEIIKPQYTEAYMFNNGLARVRSNDTFIYIDKNNHNRFNIRFKEASDFSEGLAYVNNNGKYGIINTSGKFIITPHYENVGRFKRGIATYFKGDAWGYINRSGQIIWQPSI